MSMCFNCPCFHSVCVALQGTVSRLHQSGYLNGWGCKASSAGSTAYRACRSAQAPARLSAVEQRGAACRQVCVQQPPKLLQALGPQWVR